MPRPQTDLEHDTFNLLTRSTGTVAVRFRNLVRSGQATQRMMENALVGTIEYLEKHGFDRAGLKEFVNVGKGNNRNDNQSESRQNGGLNNADPRSRHDSRTITARKGEAKEEAFSAPNEDDPASTLNYICGTCSCLVQTNMKECPGCRRPLYFNRVRS